MVRGTICKRVFGVVVDTLRELGFGQAVRKWGRALITGVLAMRETAANGRR